MNHCHDDHHREVNYNRAFAIAVTANLLFTLLETLLAFYAHSSSLLADAGHNLGDVLGLLLAWGANWLMQRKSANRYSYGYKRTSILAAFSNAVILIGTAVLIAAQSVEKLISQHPMNTTIVIVAAGVGILVNAGTAMLFMRSRGDMNIEGAFLHLAYDALVSLGVVVTAIVVAYTGWLWADPVMGLVIVLVILWGTWGLFNKSLGMVLDAVPKHIDIEDVRAWLEAAPCIQNVHDLHVWSLSTREVAMTAHVIVEQGYLSNDQYTTINCALEKKFGIHHVTIQVEQERLGGDDGHIRCGC
jgi:cobalt-zinc-cadmium efflux system protein